MMPVDGEVTPELQRPGFAGSTAIGVDNGFEVGVVGEPQDAAVHLDTGKAQHLAPDLVDDDIERLFGTERIVARLKEACLIENAVTLRAPEMGEFGAEGFPDDFDRIEQIGAHAISGTGRVFVSALRKIAHPEIGKQHADVEADRSVERELRVDDAGLVVGHHNRTGMQIAMAERFGFCREQMFQPLCFDLEVAVGAKLGHDRIELGRGVTIKLGLEIGIGKHQVFGDVAKLDIVGEKREVRLLFSRGHGEVGAAKERTGDEEAEVTPDFRQLPPVDQRAPQNDVRRQELHDDERLGFVEEIDLRHETGVTRCLALQGMIFEIGALQRQRPAFADKAHIGQRLLDDGSAPVAGDDEDQIEVAVADFLNAPARKVRPDFFSQDGVAAEFFRQRRSAQRLEDLLVHIVLLQRMARASTARSHAVCGHN